MNECKATDTGDALLPALLAGRDAEVARASRGAECRAEGQPTHGEFDPFYRGKCAVPILIFCIQYRRGLPWDSSNSEKGGGRGDGGVCDLSNCKIWTGLGYKLTPKTTLCGSAAWMDGELGFTMFNTAAWAPLAAYVKAQARKRRARFRVAPLRFRGRSPRRQIRRGCIPYRLSASLPVMSAPPSKPILYGRKYD